MVTGGGGRAECIVGHWGCGRVGGAVRHGRVGRLRMPVVREPRQGRYGDAVVEIVPAHVQVAAEPVGTAGERASER